MKTKIQIKSIFGVVLFEYEKENNTIKDTLIEAVKKDADLRGAYLHNADLRDANLNNADLRDANLNNADLSDANLNGGEKIPYMPLACPSDGSFIGWKKVGQCLIQLEIPADAKRSSATSFKCRCDKAKVISITDLAYNESRQKIVNHLYSQNTVYKVGEMVYPDSFDDNRWNECSHGIHFFINKQEAINY